MSTELKNSPVVGTSDPCSLYRFMRTRNRPPHVLRRCTRNAYSECVSQILLQIADCHVAWYEAACTLAGSLTDKVHTYKTMMHHTYSKCVIQILSQTIVFPVARREAVIKCCQNRISSFSPFSSLFIFLSFILFG